MVAANPATAVAAQPAVPPTAPPAPQATELELSLRSLLSYAPHWTPAEASLAERLLAILPRPLWIPLPGRQTQAYLCQADELFYGGAAGAGKTDLLIGLAVTQHRNSIIFRREYPQLRAVAERSRQIVGTGNGRFNSTAGVWRLADGQTIEFGAAQHEWDVERYQGRPHDFKGFDEITHFTRSQYRFLTGWLRTTIPGQRTRVVATGNPPTTPEGRWVVEEWAPWLDDQFADPAEPGELRYYAMIDNKLTWFRTGEPIDHKGEVITPRSRTFIPGRVDDNPHLLKSGYKTVLQNMPEPLRSQMLFGDFRAGMEDNAWQVIPTEWIRAAQRRWAPERPAGVACHWLTAVGLDVARGGACKTVLAERYGHWLAPLRKYPGQSTPDGPAVVGLLLPTLNSVPTDKRGQVVVNFDVIGVGAGVADAAKMASIANMVPINFAAGAVGSDRTNNMRFRNLRAWAYWHVRDLLDPATNPTIALPPDNELLADLTAPRWSLTTSGVLIEKKEEIEERIGRSPDCGDAVVYALLPTAARGIVPRAF